VLKYRRDGPLDLDETEPLEERSGGRREQIHGGQVGLPGSDEPVRREREAGAAAALGRRDRDRAQ
jgi:hypothetical protein